MIGCRNYVIQSLIEKEIRSVTSGIINQLRGRFVSLSLNKYGSYVVEKCIRWSSEMDTILIIKEIIYDRNFLTVLQDAFGNYVAQSALAVAKVLFSFLFYFSFINIYIYI